MPLPLIGAAILNSLIILLGLSGFALARSGMSGLGVAIMLVLVGLPCFGIYSILKRKTIARKFNIWFIGFWAVFAGVLNLAAGVRGDLVRAGIGVVVLVITVPVIRGLLKSPSVVKWLQPEQPEPIGDPVE